MKCKIVWFEYHICVDEEDEKELLDMLPIGSRIISGDEDLVGFECIDTFEADNIEEAKKIVKEDYNEVEIFGVVNADTGERLFTEEDFE